MWQDIQAVWAKLIARGRREGVGSRERKMLPTPSLALHPTGERTVPARQSRSQVRIAWAITPSLLSRGGVGGRPGYQCEKTSQSSPAAAGLSQTASGIAVVQPVSGCVLPLCCDKYLLELRSDWGGIFTRTERQG